MPQHWCDFLRTRTNLSLTSLWNNKIRLNVPSSNKATLNFSRFYWFRVPMETASEKLFYRFRLNMKMLYDLVNWQHARDVLYFRKKRYVSLSCGWGNLGRHWRFTAAIVSGFRIWVDTGFTFLRFEFSGDSCCLFSEWTSFLMRLLYFVAISDDVDYIFSKKKKTPRNCIISSVGLNVTLNRR